MKNIFDEFNNMDIDLDEYDEVALDENEVNDIKNRVSKKLNPKKKTNFKPMAAIIAGALITTMVLNFDTVSAKIKELSMSLKTYFTEIIDRDMSDYTIKVGQTVTDKGISVTLNEFILDNNLIMVNYDIDYSKSGKELGYGKMQFRPKININGAKIDGGVGPGITEVSEGVINQIMIFSMENLEAKGPYDVNIGFNFTDMEAIEGKDYFKDIPIDGNWEYKFEISDEKVNQGIKTMELTENNIVHRGGQEVKITEVIKSDLTLRIKYEWLDESRNKGSSGFGGSEDKNPSTINDPLKFSGVFDGNGDGFKMSVTKHTDNKGEVYYFLNDKDINKFIIKTPVEELVVDFDENN